MSTVKDLKNFTHSANPLPIKPSILSSSLSLPTDGRVRLIKGNTNSTIRKFIASSKKENELKKSLTISIKEKTVDESFESKFDRFSSYPIMKPEIDLMYNLIDQNENKIQKIDQNIQSDVFLERPESPAYITPKIGCDIGTQMEDNSEIFDFDNEVVPLVEVIVSKTVEQALFELNTEHMLLNIQNTSKKLLKDKEDQKSLLSIHQNIFLDSNKEKVIKINQLKIKKSNENNLSIKSAAYKFVNTMIPTILDQTFDRLLLEGTLIDPIQFEIKSNTLKETTERILDFIEIKNSAYILIDGIYLCSIIYDQNNNKIQFYHFNNFYRNPFKHLRPS